MRDKKCSKVADFLLLVVTAILVAVVGTGAFWAADTYHLNAAWIFAVGSAVGFFVVVGWGYRSRLRSPAFAVFFGTWTLVHVIVFLAVLAYLGIGYYLPVVTVELFVGYTFAIWQFGPPTDKAIR